MNYKGVKDKVFSCIGCGANIPFKGHSYYHKYCSNKCQGKATSTAVKEKHEQLFNEGKLTSRRRIYSLLIERDGNKCSVCSIELWNNKPIRFWVDHIDGNASNNNPTNFRLICPNCDSQSETFGAKNTGKGRKSIGLKTYG